MHPGKRPGCQPAGDHASLHRTTRRDSWNNTIERLINKNSPVEPNGTTGLLSCQQEGVVKGKAVGLRFQVGLQPRHLRISCFSSGMRWVKSTSRMRRQMPASVSWMRGRWFVASSSLNSGRNSNSSPYWNRASVSVRRAYSGAPAAGDEIQVFTHGHKVVVLPAAADGNRLFPAVSEWR